MYLRRETADARVAAFPVPPEVPPGGLFVDRRARFAEGPTFLGRWLPDHAKPNSPNVVPTWRWFATADAPEHLVVTAEGVARAPSRRIRVAAADGDDGWRLAPGGWAEEVASPDGERRVQLLWEPADVVFERGGRSTPFVLGDTDPAQVWLGAHRLGFRVVDGSLVEVPPGCPIPNGTELVEVEGQGTWGLTDAQIGALLQDRGPGARVHLDPDPRPFDLHVYLSGPPTLPDACFAAGPPPPTGPRDGGRLPYPPEAAAVGWTEPVRCVVAPSPFDGRPRVTSWEGCPAAFARAAERAARADGVTDEVAYTFVAGDQPSSSASRR